MPSRSARRVLLALAIVAATTVVARRARRRPHRRRAPAAPRRAARDPARSSRARSSARSAAFLALNYFFTAPTGSLDVQKGDDLVALVVFVGRVGACWAGRSRGSTRLRRTAEQRERETQIRLDLTTAAHGGRGPERPWSRVPPTRSSRCSSSSRARCGAPGCHDDRDEPGRRGRDHVGAHRAAGGGGGRQPRAPARALPTGRCSKHWSPGWPPPSTGSGWRPRRAKRASRRRSAARGRASCPR